MGISVSKHTSIYSFTVALFLYATMLVDLYRKLIGINTTTVRNVVYIVSLLLIVWDMLKTKHVIHMFIVFFLMTSLFFISNLINTGNEQVYFTAWSMFFMRLWPAYYIGRYTDDWASVSVVVRKFLWIAVIYAVIAYLSPYDSSGAHNSYATIATNLFFVVWLALYDSFDKRKIVSILICFICFVPILFLGTRACLFGAMFAIILFLARRISKSSVKKKARYIFLLFIGSVVLTILFSVMTDALLDLLPNSRTLKYLVKGEVFDDSTRSESFYSKLLLSLNEDPIRMRGLLGDQIFLAGENASLNNILSSFAHNVYLELCMNFGVVFGILLGLYYSIVLLMAHKKSRFGSDDIEFLYMGVLGMTFVNMMVSFSWLHAYEVWFLFGLAFSLNRRRLVVPISNNAVSQTNRL